MGRLVRSDTHRTLGVLWGAFHGPDQLVAEERAERPDQLLFRWEPSRGSGYGQLWVAKDDAEALEAVRRCRSDPAMLPCAKALLSAVLDHQGLERGWHLERAAELVYGKRNPKESRHRQLERFHLLMALFERGHFVLVAPVAQQPAEAPSKAKRAKRGRDRVGEREGQRAHYGGEHRGPLLRVIRHNHRTATVHAEELHALVRDPGVTLYRQVPESAFRLRRPGHHNPHGHRLSQAHLSRVLLAFADFVRFRQGAKTQGPLQAVTLTEFAERWAGLPVDKIRDRHLWQALVDAFEEELRGMQTEAGVKLEPVERQGPPERWMLRPILVPAPQQRADELSGGRPNGGGRREPPARRLAGVTSTGSATSTGPPRR